MWKQSTSLFKYIIIEARREQKSAVSKTPLDLELQVSWKFLQIGVSWMMEHDLEWKGYL